MEHLIGTNIAFLAPDNRFEGAAPPTGESVGDDFADVYRSTAKAVADAWDPARLGCEIHSPVGPMPGHAAIGIHTVETIVHGWDLGTATGQPGDIPPELAAAAWTYVDGFDDFFWGPGGAFSAKIELPPTASETDRLVAWLGRYP